MSALYLLLLSAAFVVVQCLIGGTRLLFSFPAYALIGAAAILSILSLRRRIPAPSSAALASTLLLAGYVLVRAWHSPVPYLAWPDLYMAAGALMVYDLSALFLTGTRQRLWIVAVLFAIAIAEVAVAFLQHTRGDGFMLFGFIRGDTSVRASGMFISGNHLAGYLEAVAMFAVSLLFWSRWPLWARLSAGAVAALCYFGVAISGSRGGYLSSAFSLVVFAFLSLRTIAMIRPGRVLATATVAGIALAALFAAAVAIGMRSDYVRDRAVRIGASTKDVRVYNWLATLDHFRLAPWLGTGAGTHVIYGRLFRRPQLQADPIHSHGDYLELLAEYGIVGEALALVFLGLHLAAGLRATRQVAIQRLGGNHGPPRSDTLALQLGALGAVAALLAHSVVDFNMHIPGNALVFAFIFGMLGNPGVNRPAAPPWFSLTTFTRLAMPVLGAGILAGVLPNLKGEQLAEEARIALRNRKYHECIALAKRAIAAEPLNPNTWFYLGEANRIIGFSLRVPTIRKDFFDEAVNAYSRGLRYFPQDIHLLTRLAQTLDGLERFEEADEVYRKAIEWDPNQGVLYAFYGAHFQLKGDKEAADKCYEAARALGANRDIARPEVESILKNRLENRPPEEVREKTE